MPELRTDEIVDQLREGGAQARADWLARLPYSPLKAVAASLLQADDPALHVVALGPLAQEYCFGSDPSLGARLADALHRRALEIRESVPGHGLQAGTLAGLAVAHLNALSLLGRSDDLLAASARYLDFYEGIGAGTETPPMRVLRAEALLNLGRVDEAADELADRSLREHPTAGIEAQRLQGWVDRYRLAAGVEKTAVPEAPEGASPESLAATVEFVIDALGSGIGGKEGQALATQLGAFSGGDDPAGADPGQFKALLDVLRHGEAFLAKGQGDSMISIRGRIRDAAGIFVGGKPSRDAILTSLADLGACLVWSREHRARELENDALWGIYLCNSRLDRPGPAAEALLRLRDNLEALRAGIAEPLQRAGIFSAYPYLYNALCEKLHAAERPAGLLEAIESSRGRVIADRLSAQAGRPVRDAAIYGAVRRLPDVVRRAGCHYLTYFVDDERVYGVLVSRDGRIHALDPVNISRETLRRAAARVRPDADDWRVSDALVPLVDWLGEFMDQGIIAEGDHLAYAADEDFCNVPLHYVPFRGGILLDSISVSRVHSAFHLERVAAGPPLRPGQGYLGVIVPTRQDLRRGRGQAFVDNLTAPLAALVREGMEGETLVMEEATLETIEERDLDHRIVHFSTHGRFPRPEEGTPYEHSWLVLASPDGLPDAERVASGRHEGCLSPAAVIAAGLDLTGSHVSMMACVSGLAREGIGGDSLGLDWALIQSGATSLVSTHWAVSASRAAQFFDGFYKRWIGEQLPRAEAFRRTLLELMGNDRSPWALSQYAAFSLTGDFR